MTKKRFLLILIIICPFAAEFPAEVALACSCAEMPGLEAAVNDASNVFTGRVVNVKKSAFREGQNEVQLSIVRAYRGEILEGNLDQITVYTPNTDDKCQFDFQRDQDYVVFTTGNLAYLKVDRCGRTAQMESSMEDIEALDKKFPR